MLQSSSSRDLDPATGDPWSELETLLDELAVFARDSVPAERFYAEVLRRAVAGLAAAGGAVWLLGPQGHFVRVQTQLPPEVPESNAFPTEVRRRINMLLEHGKSQVLPPLPQPVRESNKGGSASVNPTPYVLLQSSWSNDKAVAGIIEIFQRPGGSPATFDGYLHFLSLVCELAADYQRRSELQLLRATAKFRDDLLQFSTAAHQSLDPDRLACEVAQEARRILEVDRVSLLVSRGSHFRVRGVSGVETIESRSALVQKLESLVGLVVASGQSLSYQDSEDEVAPQLRPILQDYLTESGCRRLICLPLEVSRDTAGEADPKTADSSSEVDQVAQPLGALVIEQFQPLGSFEELQDRSESVRKVAASALRSAKEHSSMPLLIVSRGLRYTARNLQNLRLSKVVIAIAVTAAVGAALWLVPAELRIEGKGKLLPRVRRDLFAASDGVVRKIQTQHGAKVKEGEVLLELRQSQLDFEATRVLGEMQTAQQRLAAVQALRLSSNTDRGEGREKYTQLASEEEELKMQLKSLTEQRRILDARQKELIVTSPMNGQVLTWDVAELLTARPVQRGQVLLTVGDLDGPWEIEVELPDDQIGHLLAAQRGQREIPVSFILPSSPGVVLWGKVRQVSLATDADEGQHPVVQVSVDVDKSQIQPLRAGLAVIPKIHCGSHSVGYVWFHRIWEAIQTWLLF